MNIFRTQSLPVTRFNASVIDKGRYVPAGVESTFMVKASVHVVKGEELEALPEGRRNSSIFKIYTDTVLFSIDSGENKPADQVTIYGKQFEVFKIESWTNDILNHTKYYVSDVKQG